MKFNKRLFVLLIPISLLILLFAMPNRKVQQDIVYNTEYERKDIITVHIFGEVRRPGTYYLDENSTYADLLVKCGLTDLSNLDGVNLNVTLLNNSSYEVLISDNRTNIEPSTLVPDISDEKININKATQAELITLPGVGSVKAKAIINYRTKKKFLKIEDIKKVDGISENLYDSIKDIIIV